MSNKSHTKRNRMTSPTVNVPASLLRLFCPTTNLHKFLSNNTFAGDTHVLFHCWNFAVLDSVFGSSVTLISLKTKVGQKVSCCVCGCGKCFCVHCSWWCISDSGMEGQARTSATMVCHSKCQTPKSNKWIKGHKNACQSSIPEMFKEPQSVQCPICSCPVSAEGSFAPYFTHLSLRFYSLHFVMESPINSAARPEQFSTIAISQPDQSLSHCRGFRTATPVRKAFRQSPLINEITNLFDEASLTAKKNHDQGGNPVATII